MIIENINQMPSTIHSNRKISRKSLEKLNSKKENGAYAYAILLNKTYSDRIVDYAHTLYTSILDLKDSAKDLDYFVDEYKTVEDKINTLNDERKRKVNEMFEDKVNRFINDYNNAVEFADTQIHSQSLKDFSSELSDVLDQHKQVLDSLNITGDNEEQIIKSFDLTNVSEKLSIDEKLNCLQDLITDIYDSTQYILSKPMSEHMNFRGLSYYYNYKLDRYEANTFELIESGMIVDIIL